MPFLGLTGAEKKVRECKKHLLEAEQIIKNDPKIKFVILASRYDYYTDTDERRSSFKNQFTHTINELKKLNKQIVIMDQVPIFPTNPYTITFWDKVMKTKPTTHGFADIDTAYVKRKTCFTSSMFKDITTDNTIDYFNPSTIINTSEYQGKSLFYDDNHLSFRGTMFLADQIHFPLLEKKLELSLIPTIHTQS